MTDHTKQTNNTTYIPQPEAVTKRKSMKISYHWLKEYINIQESPAELARILTDIGLEVESMEEVQAVRGGLKGVVTAQVLTCIPHPNSDHLHITTVDFGAQAPLQVVCGAPNVAAGQKVLLATVGTVLYFGDQEVKIKKGKIRGEDSWGMICAEDELGIGTSHEGIMVLPADAPVGLPAAEYLGLASDTVFEIGLTPNRVDAASHLGVARDLKAWYCAQSREQEIHLPSVEAFVPGSGKGVEVRVEAPEAAPRYMGLTLTGVKVAESPKWLKERLTAIGLRPINNVVDITNFILFELGQPLHAFDRAKIEGDCVVVRHAQAGTRFVTLDGVERELHEADLMICNARREMCIAGVFGGLDSGVTEATTEVFLESAWFNPVSVRKTAKRHGLSTDASFRYERGTDPEMPPYALYRAALLMQELCGATVANAPIDLYPQPAPRAQVAFRYQALYDLVGKDLGKAQVDTIMQALDMEILEADADQVRVAVPAYRVDVQRMCDIAEDVLRIYGYNNIPLTTRLEASVNHSPRPDSAQLANRVAEFLAHNGFNEIMCNSLTRAAAYNSLTTFPAERLVKILNPLSGDLNALRQSLLPGGLETIAHNLNRQQTDLKLFEQGNVYTYDAAQDTVENAQAGRSLQAYSEAPRLALFATGLAAPQQWRLGSPRSHFFALKSYVEQLFKLLGVRADSLELGQAPEDLFAHGLSYLSKGKTVAVIGVVQPALCKAYGIKQEVYAAELAWDLIFELIRYNKVRYTELPKYPEVRRDLALVLDKEVSYARLREVALRTERKLLRRVALFDVYEGDKLPAGKKQYALSFHLQDVEKTMTDTQVEAIMNKLIKAFETQVGAKLR